MNIILYTLYTCTLADERKQQSKMSFWSSNNFELFQEFQKNPWFGEAKEDPELRNFFNWDRLADFRHFGGIRLEEKFWLQGWSADGEGKGSNMP